MCTAVLLLRPGHAWPLLFAANRDEMSDRPWRPPARHWPDRPEVVAGIDELAGGTWLGLNDHGLLAAVLNRMGSLGPQPGLRSRGELVLEALDHAEASAAAAALADLNPAAYRSFNLLVADAERAFWLRHQGDEPPAAAADGIEVFALPPGLSMLTAHDRNDRTKSPRIRNNLPRFEAATTPDPETGDWAAWREILASRLYPADEGPQAAMTVAGDNGFGTVSASLIALPAPPKSLTEQPKHPIWLFAPGPSDRTDFAPVTVAPPHHPAPTGR